MGGYPGHHHYQGSSTHGHVGTWQQALQRWGYPVTADNSFGPITDHYTRRFQTRVGLSSDGIVGPATWAAA